MDGEIVPQATQSDPWAEAAKNYQPQTGSGSAPPSGQNEDWKMWQQGGGTSEPQSLMSQAGEMAEDFGKGIIKGGLNTVNGVSSLIHKIPGGVGEALVPSSGLTAAKMYAQPANTAQSIGKGVEQTGEFMLPGEAEENAGLKLAEYAPKLGKMAEPLAKMATSAIGGGTVNKAQGGSFGTGAAMGAGGQLVGQGLKAAAPVLAETALGIPKAARAFGKTPGRAIIEETSGIRPETIAESARGRMGELTPELERAADAASVRPNQIRGLLPAPTEEIPLHSAPNVEGVPSRPVTLTQPMRPSRLGLPRPTVDTPLTENPFHGRVPPNEGVENAPINASRVGEPFATPEGNPNYGYSDQFPSAEGKWTGGALRSSSPLETPHNGRILSGESAPGMHQAEYIGQVPGERGGPGQVQGVVQHRPIVSRAATQTPIPSILPNTTASLGPARGILNDAMGRAEGQNAEGLHSQLGKMNDFLGSRFSTDEPIPENVTPRDLLNLKRGFSEEHLRWNPETHDAALSAGRRAYGALDSELDRTVPQAAGLNQRISSLIPVAQRAESISRNAPTLQRAVGRFGAHTGALFGAGVGGSVGYREGGVPGAIAGGLTGVLAPELLASPEGQMGMARTLNYAGGLKPLVGSMLQLNRKRDDQ